MIVCQSALLLSGQLSQSLDPRALQDVLCTCVVHHWYHYVLYIHLYFNTVPQIVEEQHCFQTLWKSKEVIVEINCQFKLSSKITLKALFCSRACRSLNCHLYKKGSCIVQLSLLQYIFIVRHVVQYCWWRSLTVRLCCIVPSCSS